jgi:hypothetical protein
MYVDFPILKRFANNLPKGLQSVPQMIQERVKSPQVSFGRVRVEEYKSAIAHPLAYSKDRENGVDVRSPQASFPSAEVNEIGRVWMEEEDNAAIGQPVVLEAIV